MVTKIQQSRSTFFFSKYGLFPLIYREVERSATFCNQYMNRIATALAMLRTVYFLILF